MARPIASSRSLPQSEQSLQSNFCLFSDSPSKKGRWERIIIGSTEGEHPRRASSTLAAIPSTRRRSPSRPRAAYATVASPGAALALEEGCLERELESPNRLARAMAVWSLRDLCLQHLLLNLDVVLDSAGDCLFVLEPTNRALLLAGAKRTGLLGKALRTSLTDDTFAVLDCIPRQGNEVVTIGHVVPALGDLTRLKHLAVDLGAGGKQDVEGALETIARCCPELEFLELLGAPVESAELVLRVLPRLDPKRCVLPATHHTPPLSRSARERALPHPTLEADSTLPFPNAQRQRRGVRGVVGGTLVRGREAGAPAAPGVASLPGGRRRVDPKKLREVYVSLQRLPARPPARSFQPSLTPSSTPRLHSEPPASRDEAQVRSLSLFLSLSFSATLTSRNSAVLQVVHGEDGLTLAELERRLDAMGVPHQVPGTAFAWEWGGSEHGWARVAGLVVSGSSPSCGDLQVGEGPRGLKESIPIAERFRYAYILRRERGRRKRRDAKRRGTRGGANLVDTWLDAV